MQRISWKKKKTNESVRMEIGIEDDETLKQTSLRRKLGFFGHVMRSDGLEKNDAGTWRRKEEKKTTKEKMDVRDA